MSPGPRSLSPRPQQVPRSQVWTLCKDKGLRFSVDFVSRNDGRLWHCLKIRSIHWYNTSALSYFTGSYKVIIEFDSIIYFMVIQRFYRFYLYYFTAITSFEMYLQMYPFHSFYSVDLFTSFVVRSAFWVLFCVVLNVSVQHLESTCVWTNYLLTF